ncbi:restriction endonuclease subunit S [Campylobacter jejuni]|uniref:restriction endonuclease subunit S n=1 Tax=Campylobacter sp. CFSAN093238 TaxID=2572084 RepID=UPI00139C1C4E|nr:restriction endonuclease subunit S [Campylobacter jejuni]EDP2711879.1 restriction endonuclease subunit S [Campylobacter jejuni]EDP7140967.1 restriction endonuclease subunit S [Campylobacter jejuni]EHI6452126.1 restriction endonuclease subunit S [Campylobacter jejuni]EHQ5918350.1 restriction endonuclease subunit S [Campylobacter jejuni]
MNNWKKCKLGDIAEILNNKRIPLNAMQRQKMKGKYPYYGASGIIDYVNDYLFDGEYVLISEDGENLKSRKTPIAFKASGKFWVNNHAHIIKGKMDFQNDLIVYIFKNIDLNPYLTGAVQPKLNKENLLDIDFYLPPLEEQRQIAAILSSIDDKIELLHEQNKTLEELAQTLFVNWFKDREFNSTISDFISIQNGFAFKSKDFIDYGDNGVIKIKNISNGIVDIVNTDKISQNTINEVNNKFNINSGDILFAMTGAEIGKMGIVPSTNKKLWLNQRVGMVKERFLGARFLAYIHLTSEFGYDYVINSATGSAQENISATDIENCPFVKLTSEEIVSYSKQLNDFFEKIIFNLGEIQTLENMRDILIPKLLNGEIKINN